jgi:hypothetical protein
VAGEVEILEVDPFQQERRKNRRRSWTLMNVMRSALKEAAYSRSAPDAGSPGRGIERVTGASPHILAKVILKVMVIPVHSTRCRHRTHECGTSYDLMAALPVP